MTVLELEEEYSRFIDFGGVFDKPTRTFLVHYMYGRLTGKQVSDYKIQSLLTNLDSNYYEYLRLALDRLFHIPQLEEVCSTYEALSKQIIHDVLKWMREVDKKIAAKNPYEEENKSFEAWSHKPTFLWKQTWYLLTNLLGNIYKKDELDTSFYVQKFKELVPDAPGTVHLPEKENPADRKSPLDIVIDDLLAQWNALLTAKNLRYKLEEMGKEADDFGQTLKVKIQEFTKLMSIVSPFAMEISNFWDMSRGLWKNSSFNVLDHYQHLLNSEESIRELVDLLGRMREAETELDEEIYENVIVKKEWVTDFRLKNEIGGIRGSDDLNYMLPSEAALLGHELTELLFLQKYADKNLLSYQYHGKKLVTSDKVQFATRQKQKRKEKGPFILCIDTSGSMEGLPSHIAKVLCFAIMKMAAKEKRKCYLISFSIGIKTINLLDIANSMDRIVDFLGMSFDGGTDVTPALAEALNTLQNSDYKDADVMMVSDFVMFNIREDILQRMQKEQTKGTRFHSLTLSDKPNVRVVEQFDNYWIYDPEHKGITKQLLQDLRSLDRQ